MRQTIIGEVDGERIMLELDTTNPLEVTQATESLIWVFRKHWVIEKYGPRVEYVLANAIRTLFVIPGATLADLPRLLSDQAFRESYKHAVTNPQVLEFWSWYEIVESTHRSQDTWQLIESVIARVNQLLAVSQ